MRCRKCGVVYPLKTDFFYRDKGSKSGFRSICKYCANSQHKAYFEKNKEIIAKWQKEYRKKNKDKVSGWQKKYARKNKDKLYAKNKEYLKQYVKQRAESDSIFKLSIHLRKFVGDSFHRKGFVKSDRCVEITGLSPGDLSAYLIKTFKANYGRQWDGIEPVHIDHIIPISTAQTEEDVYRLCHYTNLQLLLPEDNLLKSNKLDYAIGVR